MRFYEEKESGVGGGWREKLKGKFIPNKLNRIRQNLLIFIDTHKQQRDLFQIYTHRISLCQKQDENNRMRVGMALLKENKMKKKVGIKFIHFYA